MKKADKHVFDVGSYLGVDPGRLSATVNQLLGTDLVQLQDDLGVDLGCVYTQAGRHGIFVCFGDEKVEVVVNFEFSVTDTHLTLLISYAADIQRTGANEFLLVNGYFEECRACTKKLLSHLHNNFKTLNRTGVWAISEETDVKR